MGLAIEIAEKLKASGYIICTKSGDRIIPMLFPATAIYLALRELGYDDA